MPEVMTNLHLLLYPSSQHWSWLLPGRASDDLNPDHQAQAAHVAEERERGLQLCQLGNKIPPYLSNVW